MFKIIFKNIACLLLIFVNGIAYSQHLDILIKGSFYDDSTGLDQPAKVYSITKGKKEHLGQSYREEIFNHRYAFHLAHKADSLVFESAGYHPKAFKINFHGKFTQNTSALLSIKTLRLGRVDMPIRYIVFCQPPDADNTYQILHYYGDTLHCENHVQALSRSRTDENMSGNTRDSHYVIQTLSLTGEVLSKVGYCALPGINLVDISAYPGKGKTENKTVTVSDPRPEKARAAMYDSSSHTITPMAPHRFDESGIPVLYFQQGKYSLEPETVKTLDEIARYLLDKTSLKMIKIQGYTDGVGDKTLNETLAKYRAQAVYHYLIQKGLKSDSFTVDWQKEHESEKHETNLNQFRKVTLTEIQ